MNFPFIFRALFVEPSGQMFTGSMIGIALITLWIYWLGELQKKGKGKRVSKSKTAIKPWHKIFIGILAAAFLLAFMFGKTSYNSQPTQTFTAQYTSQDIENVNESLKIELKDGLACTERKEWSDAILHFSKAKRYAKIVSPGDDKSVEFIDTLIARCVEKAQINQ